MAGPLQFDAMKHLSTLAALVLVTLSPGPASAQMVQCQKADGSWYGASNCSMGGVPVHPVHLIPTWRECIASMDAIIKREREIGREVGFVDAAVLHAAARRKLACQNDLKRAAAAERAASR